MGKSIRDGLDVVVVSQQAWDTPIGSNCKNIAMEWAKSRRVLYVNSPLDRFSRFRERKDLRIQKRLQVIKGKRNGLEQISERLWTLYPDVLIESINWINQAALFDVFNKRNNRLFARSIKQAMNSLNFNDFILFNDNEMFKAFYLPELLKPVASIYYSRDYMLAVAYWKKHGQRLEPQLIAKSDVCVANSSYLADYCRQHNVNSYYVGQGCDTALFEKSNLSEIPEVITAHQGPVVGYVGALQELRLDMEVIEYIATERPGWLLVLVGPQSEVFSQSRLHAIPNILFTGIQPQEQLASYIESFDVCINPQLVNEVTIGNYPRKIDEYLLMGKPTVATATKAMEIFDNYVWQAHSKEEYVNLIEQALNTDSIDQQQARRHFAKSHTWENSVSAIDHAISGIKMVTL